eukprot:9963631-Alexandrium_andersonii.AAC.1
MWGEDQDGEWSCSGSHWSRRSWGSRGDMDFGPSPEDLGEPDEDAEDAWRAEHMDLDGPVDPEGEEAAVLRELEDASRTA